MSKKLWGGRFKKSIDKDFEQFSKSIHYDYRLAKYDIYHSLAHVSALQKMGILTIKEQSKLLKVLGDILGEVRRGEFSFDPSSEDIHTDIQNRLEKKIGKLALKLHSLRSRNDQIAFDTKWYCIHESNGILHSLNELLKGLLSLLPKYKNNFFIGYTHLQRAQVIPFGDYLGAFVYMFRRDFDRVGEFFNNLFPKVGSGALAGTSITRDAYKQALKSMFVESKEKLQRANIEDQIVKNPLDNTSDRDFIVEFLSILSILQMHLSRVAEDFIIYSTKEFDFFDLPEEFCTGSSLMPHKKNPDFLELVRGYTGRIYGSLISVLTTMKGLPLAYNRDMQLDKEPLFEAVSIVKDELKIMAKFIRGLRLKEDNIARALEDESLYATEMAEFLVYSGVAFKDAHTIIGKLIRYSEDKRIKIEQMSDKLLRSFHKKLTHKDIKRIMNPKHSVTSKKSVSRKLPKIKRVK